MRWPLALLPLLLASPARADDGPYFTDVTLASGVDFVHRSGHSKQYDFPEIAGPGGALFDADGDGDLDLYLVQGGALRPGGEPAPRPSDRLYRNDTVTARAGETRLRFTDITETSGIRAPGYGMGAAAGDADGDGDLDLYVTNVGANQLWLNRGRGPAAPIRFEESAAASGVASEAWSVSAVFFDADGDGATDLYVVNYVDFSIENNIVCYAASSRRDYCGPQAYHPVADHLYRNLGNDDQGRPRFADVTNRWLAGYRPGSGLGVAVLDAEGDGDLDVYVANDGEANQLWLRQSDDTFREEALFAGVAVNGEGKPEASMGIAVADPDADGDDDLFITHLSRETNTFYANLGNGLFEDRSVESGLGAPSLPMTGFGTAWLDLDGDGWLDLAVVDGAVRIQEALAARGDPYPLAQPNQLFHHLGLDRTGRPHFAPVSARGGRAFTEPSISRGLLAGDLDGDGDTDLIIAENEGPPRVLRNNLDPAAWIGLRLVAHGRDAIGARVAIRLAASAGQPTRTLWRHAAAGGSYASSSDPRALAALGRDRRVIEIEVHWPGGAVERFEPPAMNRYTTLVRGTGLRERGAGERGTGERGTGERGTGERGTGERGTGNTRTGHTFKEQP